MENENKTKVIFSLTEEFHNDITNIYELLVDEENTEGLELIDELRKKLKALKDNINEREEI